MKAVIRYFRKTKPLTPIFTSKGGKIKFETMDFVTGYFKTDDENLIKEIDAAIDGKRGGVTGIDKKTFEAEFVEKKRSYEIENKGPLRPPNREEITADSPMDTLGPVGRVAPVAAKPPPPPPVSEDAPRTGKANSQ